MTSSAPPSARPGPLLRILLFWTALPFVLFWLPLVRSVMDGASYEWGVGWWGWRLGGAGLAGDIWYLVLGTLLGVTLLWSGWQGGGRFFRIALPIWFLLLLSRSLHWAIQDPQGFVFRGDTLGVEVNLTWIAPGFHLAGLLLFLVWVVRTRSPGVQFRSDPGGRRWTRRNTRRLAALAALLPLQFMLLGWGEPHGATDAAGVLITIGQWLSLGWALAPVGGRDPGAIRP